MGASARIGRDVGLVRGDGFAGRCRTSPADFTRRRKMPADLLALSVVARKGRTLKIELRELAREAEMDEAISAPGYLKAREKLNPKALLCLAQHHAANVYADGDYETYKGMLVVAVDGTTVNVPTTPETLERYGDASSGGARPQAVMGVSAAYDAINRQLLDLTLNRGFFDERAQVSVHAGALPGVVGDLPFMLVMDRGYPSLPLIAELADAGVPFVMRCQSRFMSPEFRRAAAAGADLEVESRLTASRLSRTKERDPEAYERLKGRALKARYVLIDVGAESPERLVTNIPAEALSPDELKEVYHLRWGVETCFQMLKDRLQVENMTGTKPVLIEQDVYASAYLLNAAFDLANEAESGIEQERYKHTMTVSKSLAIGVLKHELVGLVLADDSERDAMMSAIAAELRRNVVPVRRNRRHPRDGLGSHRSCKYSNTHKRVF